jgi:hypothetical protein
LQFTERLQLTENTIDGVIPVELSFLTHLVVLGLGRNNLVGEIPSDLGKIHSLGKLYFAAKTWFSTQFQLQH